jgi:hypothetical protein
VSSSGEWADQSWLCKAAMGSSAFHDRHTRRCVAALDGTRDMR